MMQPADDVRVRQYSFSVPGGMGNLKVLLSWDGWQQTRTSAWLCLGGSLHAAKCATHV